LGETVTSHELSLWDEISLSLASKSGRRLTTKSARKLATKSVNQSSQAANLVSSQRALARVWHVIKTQARYRAGQEITLGKVLPWARYHSEQDIA
jgi:4-diphosphocytidyl-2C-methyl-D-erythritol kinase